MDELKRRLKDENMKCETPSKTDSRGIMVCLKKIDDANVVYIVNPEGYIGKSVSVDIGYAYAKDKPIYAMHSVDDPSVMDLMDGVLSPKELIDSLKKGSMSEK